MIEIHHSPTADTRTCDYSTVSRDTLLTSSVQHIGDVAQALGYFSSLLLRAAARHDYDKLADIDGFHADFLTGFKNTAWWDRHRKLNRHHLLQADGVPEDVNLIDVLDLIADCVMAGMARSGSVYPILIDATVLMRAFQNTAKLLEAQVVVTNPPEKRQQFHRYVGLDRADDYESGLEPAESDGHVPGVLTPDNATRAF